MFFLLRMAFWIGLVLVLLPTDDAKNDGKGAARTSDKAATEINAVDALSAAGAAISDMSQFCTRQPQACAVGGQAATTIGQRAQSGARKVYQYILEKKPDHTGSISDAERLGLGAMEAGDGTPHQAMFAPSTLTPTDLGIGWRDPAGFTMATVSPTAAAPVIAAPASVSAD